MGPYRRIKYLTLLATFLWSSLILTSCATLSGCNSCTLSPAGTGYTKPYKPNSFTLIEVALKLKPSKCVIKGTGQACDEMLTMLPPKTIETRGSGTVVKVVKNETYVLTADHVCSHPGESQFEMPYLLGPPDAPRMTAVITVQQTTEVSAVDGDGISHKSVVHATDALNDVCLIRSPGGWGIERVVPVAESMPNLGAPVYNLAAPFGIFEPGKPGVKLHFQGRYSGSDTRGNYFYTIPARPGSSGSSVLNVNGEIIGVIHSAMIHFESVALASSLTSIQALMATIPEEEKPHPHQEVMHHFIFGF